MAQGYPKIVFTEEVMREGMQIESASIPNKDKIELLNGDQCRCFVRFVRECAVDERIMFEDRHSGIPGDPRDLGRRISFLHQSKCSWDLASTLVLEIQAI